jgi:hypothetical protein
MRRRARGCRNRCRRRGEIPRVEPRDPLPARDSGWGNVAGAPGGRTKAERMGPGRPLLEGGGVWAEGPSDNDPGDGPNRPTPKPCTRTRPRASRYAFWDRPNSQGHRGVRDSDVTARSSDAPTTDVAESTRSRRSPAPVRSPARFGSDGGRGAPPGDRTGDSFRNRCARSVEAFWRKSPPARRSTGLGPGNGYPPGRTMSIKGADSAGLPFARPQGEPGRAGPQAARRRPRRLHAREEIWEGVGRAPGSGARRRGFCPYGLPRPPGDALESGPRPHEDEPSWRQAVRASNDKRSPIPNEVWLVPALTRLSSLLTDCHPHRETVASSVTTRSSSCTQGMPPGIDVLAALTNRPRTPASPPMRTHIVERAPARSDEPGGATSVPQHLGMPIGRTTPSERSSCPSPDP